MTKKKRKDQNRKQQKTPWTPIAHFETQEPHLDICINRGLKVQLKLNCVLLGAKYTCYKYKRDCTKRHICHL